MSGSPLSRYAIRRKLGEGGMAEVLEAVAHGEAGFTRRVAIKRLRASHTEDPAFARMFVDEARIASELHHAGIVAVIDYGVVDGAPFQILEFVDGANARELYERGVALKKPMPIEVALLLALEVARAIHYAHGVKDESGAPRGVVHRDVKPANILVSNAGDVKLGDFGVAFAHERTEQTQAGTAKGTPGYMAPEQMLGGSVDGRADIFSLGCTLHALVASMSPMVIPGNAERLLAREPLVLANELPEDVAKIVRRATEALPSARYATGAMMADDIGKALAARLQGDAKGALSRWLDEIRETKPQAASLDALLMPEGLLERTGDSWHLETASISVIVDQKAPPPPKKRWPYAIAFAVIASGAALVVIAPWRAHETASASTATSIASAPSAIASTTSEASPSTSLAIDVTSASPNASIAIAHATHTTTTTTSSAASSIIVGTVAVRGGAYRGATISIDGKIAPYGAPHYFDLPVGKHMIALTVDGGASASGTIELRADHTPNAPLYWPQ